MIFYVLLKFGKYTTISYRIGENIFKKYITYYFSYLGKTFLVRLYTSCTEYVFFSLSNYSFCNLCCILPVYKLFSYNSRIIHFIKKYAYFSVTFDYICVHIICVVCEFGTYTTCN